MKPSRPSLLHLAALTCAVTAALTGCWTVGPKYLRPTIETPQSYKELMPNQLKATAGWKTAQPRDDVLHGRWWEPFGDPLLNTLEEQVDVSNQNIAASFAALMAARAMVREARAGYSPTVSAVPSATVQSASAGPNAFALPIEASWMPDLWGRIRSTVNQSVANAQASAADLELERLTEQAEVAIAYYDLRGQDALQRILDETVVAQRSTLDLTKRLYQTGIDDEAAVAQADATLQTTEAQALNVGIARAQYEHAIAVLLGLSPSTFSIPVDVWRAAPPAIPFGVPSQLLERRPDVAASERSVAAANAQIGIGIAAFYPTITLSAAGGLASSSLPTLFSLPSLFWSLGASVSQIIFDGGLRKATVDQYRANYNQTVATYRQTVLAAFQQVEDSLSTLRILSRELDQQDVAIRASEKSLALEVPRYTAGIDPYLNVLVAQLTLLGNEQTAVTLRTEQMTTSVQLIEALGGGWDDSKIPSTKALTAAPMTATATHTGP
jgi:NodT family efflux transporter outer membrane factor (OMF) lipoprotein